MNGILKHRPNASMVVALVALFVALSGAAFAAQNVAKNSVVSKSIKNGQVKGVDVNDDSLTGSDVNEATLKLTESASPSGTSGGTPGGTAGGDLAGTYPNPSIKNGSVTIAKLADEAQPRVVAFGRVNKAAGQAATLAANSVGLTGVSTPSLNQGETIVAVQLAVIPGASPKTVSKCNVQVTPVTGPMDGGLDEPAIVNVAVGSPLSPTEIQVQTRDSAGTQAARSYFIQVSCPPG
jgi:hypothetical protein